MKKKGLDDETLANYRPISNLNTVSKIIKRLFLAKLRAHVAGTGNFNPLQSGFRAGHSTETALQAILNDVFMAVDRKELTLLVALDISAAFDTLEHDILMSRLGKTFGISGLPLTWLESYLADQDQFVRIEGDSSRKLPCEFGVLQGSVLGPMLFTLYVSPVGDVIERLGLHHHQYADDTQLYVSFKTSDRHTAMENTGMAADRVRKWFALNGLKLNPDKTEVMLVGTSQNLASSGDCSSFDMSGSSVRLVDQVKSLGVTIDSRLKFDKHISNICRASYMNIKALRQIRSSLDSETANSVACAIVTTCLDYCNSILHGITQSNLLKLQRIQNMLARVVCVHRRYDHASPLLKRNCTGCP